MQAAGSIFRLVIFRHGIAFDRLDPRCPPDPERPLTKKGIRRTELAARGLVQSGVLPQLVVSSPYRRAVETARIVCKEASLPESSVEQISAMLPDADPQELLFSRPVFDVSTLVCVGHAPHLDELIAASIGVRGGTITRLKKAGAACVEFDEGATVGRLQWVATPRLLRRLGGET